MQSPGTDQRDMWAHVHGDRRELFMLLVLSRFIKGAHAGRKTDPRKNTIIVRARV